MQEFHRFVALKKGASSSSFLLQQKNDQRNKQHSNYEDEKYLLEDQSSSNQNQINQQPIQEDQNDQIDPLDAFMSGLQQDVAKNRQTSSKRQSVKLGAKQQSKYYKTNQPLNNQTENAQQQYNLDDQNQNSFQQSQSQQQIEQQIQSYEQQSPQYGYEQIQNEQKHRNQFQQEMQKEYDIPESQRHKDKKIIETLKPFDFANVKLQDFQKDFYDEHPDITRLAQTQVKNFRKQLEIKVSGLDVPKPIISFGHLELDQKMKRVIVKQQFQKPTPIQIQALPAALKGRDLIGVAKTGSGKTLAYVWPMITHVGHQRQSKRGQGPVGLVLAPTRQLCQQIYVETKKYAKRYDMRISCLLGGQNKHQQWKTLKIGVDILIASPGRLIEMIKKKATNLFRFTYLVLDQADKMLSLGFEQQIRSIVSQTRPDRQTLLFTATMKKSMQFLAFDILDSPIRINVGEQNSANQDVKQQVLIVSQRQQKLNWLRVNLQQILTEGKVLIFCNQRDSCEQIKQFVQNDLSLRALSLHGDKSQFERTSIMNAFKTNQSILIATDIAGRGIDVKNIKTVVNFQCPKTIEAYIHRIGRAGRAGQTGTAISFLTKSPNNIKFAIELIKIFENSGYPVSKQLQDLACLDDFYRRKRISSKMGVSFAKGKDASKFLNQILKKQQMGNSRAGLGMNPNLAAYNVKEKGVKNFSSFTRQRSLDQQEDQNDNEKTIADILRDRNLSAQNLSITELSKIIREQKQIKDRKNLSSSKLKSHFVRSSQGRIGNYEPEPNQTQSKSQREQHDLQKQQVRKTGKEVTITLFKGKCVKKA